MARASTPRSHWTFPNPSKSPYSEHPRRSLLAGDEVAVWWLATHTVGRADLHRWFGMLDQDERERAGRFHFEVDRREFIAAHALLRSVLTSYLDFPSPAWRFSIDANGKPRIAPDIGSPELQFNLSHTRGLVAVAVASHGRVGIDVERINGTTADFTVAEAHFAPAELEMLLRMPAADRPICFFRLWTLKEAYIKAIGTGLDTALDSFTFAFEPIRIEFRPGASGHTTDWQFAILPTTDQHVLSVAVGRPAGDAARVLSRAVAPQNL